MSKRIAVLVPFAFDETGLAGRRQQQQSVSWGEGIEFTYVPVSAGPQWYENYHDWILADLAMLECALRIQDDGYDAICIDTMSDSGVNAIRCELDIPVIGPGRTSYMTALMLGNKFGVLTQWGPWAAIYKKGIGELGLMEKCAGIRHIDTPPDVVNLLGGKEEVVFPKLLAAAMQLVEEDGAVYQMRRWYQQFYVDVADVSAEMVDRFEIEVDTTAANEKWHVEVEENLKVQEAEKQAT